MKTTPIIFNAEMVRALLDGRKTQTRRIVRAGTRDDWNACPYGQPGDLLWVRETWGYYQQFFSPIADDGGPVVYRADGEPTGCHGTHWRPSIHIPRKFSRLTLRLTDVRVQRVQDISEEDARAEGASPTGVNATVGAEHVAGFWLLWDSINAKRGHGWDANPWVWALTFDVLHANVDAVIARAAA